ncbi:MAG: hypothetical protein KKB34_16145 [Bacteroidetes bacterium]|nr:hypothetical protein [Bacteroidota bacterium]
MENIIQIDDPKLYTLLNQDAIEGVNVKLKPFAQSRDFRAGEIIFTVIITIATGIPTSIVANWIYDKIKNTKLTQITINRKVIDVKNKSSIKIIEESIKINSEK